MGGYNGYDLSSWVGFANNNYGYATLQITCDLGSVQNISAVRALSLSETASGIYHPGLIEVQVSQDGANWSWFGWTGSFPTDTPNFAVMWGEVDGSARARYVQYTFSYQQWLFLAELEVIGPP